MNVEGRPDPAPEVKPWTAARRLMCSRWGALFILAVVAWIAALGLRGLYNPDEGRYAEIPREMLASGDWVIPHLDGLVYIEKPPLAYWATAVSEALFGLNAWAARLYTGLCALATVLVIWLLVRDRFGQAAAQRSAIMLGSSLLFVLLGHQLLLDMSLTLYMTLTFAGFCAAQDERHGPRLRRWCMLLSWAGMAAAFLTKGLIAGALPVLTLAAYTLLQRDFKPWTRLRLRSGVPVFLVLSLPWLALIQHRLPQFFHFFFIREHFQRYLTKIEDRYQPWWFFIPVLLLGCLPWLVPALRALGRDWRARVPRGQFDLRRFAWLWCVVIFVFFSSSDSKLLSYILPIFPALALLMATGPTPRLNADLRATGAGMMLLGVLLLAAGANLPQLLHDPRLYDPARAPIFLHIRGPLLLMAVILLAGGIGAWRLRDGELGPTTVVGVTGYACFMAVLWAASVLAPLYSGAGLYAQLPPALARGVPVYSVRTYDQSLTFYLRRPVTLVAWRGELDFGLSLQPQRGIPTLAAFEPVWRAAPQALAVMQPGTYAQLMRDGLPMVLRASSPPDLIVSRR